mgnify:CR=1 FL=1
MGGSVDKCGFEAGVGAEGKGGNGWEGFEEVHFELVMEYIGCGEMMMK